MTTPPFYGRTEEWTDAELRADLALCRKVLRDGMFNGYPLDSETEVEWKDWLHDFECDAEMREELEATMDANDYARAERTLPLSNAA